MEQVLERIAVALEKLVGGPAANPGVDLVPVVVAPKKAKAVKVLPEESANDLFGGEEPKADVKVVSEESVREIVKKYAEAESPEKAMELLKKFKVKRLRELKPEQYAEVVEVFTAAIDA
jgi:hypothetical protein